VSDRARPSHPPWLTLGVVAGLCALYLISDPWMLGFWAISKQSLGSGGWFRLFTAVVHHADVGHLVQNAVALLVLGGLLEQRIGATAVLCVLLGAGTAGALCSAGFVSGASVGASGGIYGVVGVWLVLLGVHGTARSNGALLPTGLWLMLVGFFLADTIVAAVGYGSSSDSGTGAPEVDWAAHLGGLAAGLAFGLWWRRGARPGRVSGSQRRCVRRVAASLALLYTTGWAVGLRSFGDGGPATIAQLPDGPRKWLLANNRAWKESVEGGVERERLARWRDLMEEVVRESESPPEYADTLATLHYVLGDPWSAVDLEREVSWQQEREPYTSQFARFAWAAVQSGVPRARSLRLPDRIRLVARSDELLTFSVDRAPGVASPRSLDLLCLRAGEPVGMLRVELSLEPSLEFAVPRELLLADSDPQAAESLELVVVAAELEAAPARQGEDEFEQDVARIRYWARSLAEFSSMPKLDEGP